MNSRSRIILASALTALLCGCGVKDYPREVNTIEKGMTNLAYGVDGAGARVMPKRRTGQRYNLQRQTPYVDYSFYWNKRFKREPNLYYLESDPPTDVTVERTLLDNKRVKADLIKWKSQYWPQNPDFALHYQNFKGAQSAYAVYVRSKSQQKSKGVIVIAHDWVGQDITATWKKHDLLDYAKLGYDSVLIQLPYHGLRRLDDMAFSGEFFLSGDVARLNEAMCQSVADMRSMAAWLRGKYKVVGASGKGMGGTTALMSAVVDKNIDFVVAWSPPTSLGEMLEQSPMAPFVIQGLRLSGLDEETIKKIVWVASPANYEPAIAPERVLILAGMGDRMVQPDQINRLLRRWGSLNVYWYAGGNLSNFQKSRCRNREARFMLSMLPRQQKAKAASKDPSKKSQADQKKKKKQEDQKKKSPRNDVRDYFKRDRQPPPEGDQAAPPKDAP